MSIARRSGGAARGSGKRDSNPPSSFEALMNTHSTALTRPCSAGGVTRSTVVERMFMLIMSAKPASASAYVAEAAFRILIDADLLPKGAIQLLVGPTGDLFDHLAAHGFTAPLVPRLLEIVPSVAELMNALGRTQPAGAPRSELL